MNIAVFTTAMALGLALAKRREKHQVNLENRDQKKPQYPAIRDRLVSMYPVIFLFFQ